MVHRFSKETLYIEAIRVARQMADRAGETARLYREMPGGKVGCFIACLISDERPAGTYLESAEPRNPDRCRKCNSKLAEAGSGLCETCAAQ